MLEEFQQRLADEEKRWEKLLVVSMNFFSICRGMKVSNYEELLTSNAFSDILLIILCYWFVYRCADSQDRQDRANKTLVNVKAGIEHLADKLQHLKAVRTHHIAVRLLQALEEKEQ